MPAAVSSAAPAERLGPQSLSGKGRPGARFLEAAGVGGVLLLGLVAVFAEVRGHWTTHLPGALDSRMFLNVLLWDVEAFRQGKVWHELWQLPSLYPEPNVLATSEHMLGGAALFAPFYLLTGQPILAFNLLLVLVTILNFLSAYLVARRLLRAPVPALFSAVLFTFGSYRLYQIVHLQLWLHFPTPVLFLAAVRLSERPGWRWPLLAGLGLAGQFYLGMSLGYFAGLMLGLMLLTLACCAPARFADARFLLRLGLAAAVAGLLLLPLARPYQEAARRWGCWGWRNPVASLLPGWHNLFTPALDGEPNPRSLARASERAISWGYLAWVLFAAGAAALVRQGRRCPEPLRFWPLACVVLVGALSCLAVNAIGSYKFLFRVLPGFNGLRVPGRLALLALWPCGLVGGWGLARGGQALLPRTPRVRTLLGLAVVGLLFRENYHRLGVLQQYWSDVRVPRAAFYEEVVKKLPPGALASVPLGGPAGDPYPVAEAVAAGWRPTLNVYTSRMPPWWPALVARAEQLRTPHQAAALLGEFRLRGIRYLVLDKQQLAPDRLRCWGRARTHDGRPWGQTVHDDESNRVLDLEAAPPEACLPADWAWVLADGGAVSREQGRAAGYLPPHSGLAFEPCMPLRPGRYQATFELQADGAVTGLCQVTRLFLGSPRPWLRDWKPPPVPLASVLLGRQAGEFPVRLAFTVPPEAGPEPVLQFRVLHGGGGSLRVRQVLLTSESRQ